MNDEKLMRWAMAANAVTERTNINGNSTAEDVVMEGLTRILESPDCDILDKVWAIRAAARDAHRTHFRDRQSGEALQADDGYDPHTGAYTGEPFIGPDEEVHPTWLDMLDEPDELDMRIMAAYDDEEEALQAVQASHSGGYFIEEIRHNEHIEMASQSLTDDSLSEGPMYMRPDYKLDRALVERATNQVPDYLVEIVAELQLRSTAHTGDEFGGKAVEHPLSSNSPPDIPEYYVEVMDGEGNWERLDDKQFYTAEQAHKHGKNSGYNTYTWNVTGSCYRVTYELAAETPFDYLPPPPPSDTYTTKYPMPSIDWDRAADVQVIAYDEAARIHSEYGLTAVELAVFANTFARRVVEEHAETTKGLMYASIRTGVLDYLEDEELVDDDVIFHAFPQGYFGGESLLPSEKGSEWVIDEVEARVGPEDVTYITLTDEDGSITGHKGETYQVYRGWQLWDTEPARRAHARAALGGLSWSESALAGRKAFWDMPNKNELLRANYLVLDKAGLKRYKDWGYKVMPKEAVPVDALYKTGVKSNGRKVLFDSGQVFAVKSKKKVDFVNALERTKQSGDFSVVTV